MALIKGNAEEILSGNARLEEIPATFFCAPNRHRVQKRLDQSKRDVQEEKEKTPNNTAKSLSHVYIYIYINTVNTVLYTHIYIYISVIQIPKRTGVQDPQKEGQLRR